MFKLWHGIAWHVMISFNFARGGDNCEFNTCLGRNGNIYLVLNLFVMYEMRRDEM